MTASLRIATRKSPLALWQARHVAQLLGAREPGLSVELVELVTAGDRFLRAPLFQIGGKGLFVKEIETALLEGRADVAVHSLKDLTSQMPKPLCLAAVPEREDPRDAWVSVEGCRLDQLPPGSRVGTGSLRRACQLRAGRPDLEVVPLRGNVQRRLDKTREMALAGTVLALAGLRRLGLQDRVTEILSLDQSLPAVGQGALALQCRADDAHTRERLEPLDHAATRLTVEAERAFLARLEGGCTVPLAAHAVLEGDALRLRALIGEASGSRIVRGERSGPVSERVSLGRGLAEALLEQGGAALLNRQEPVADPAGTE
jgi:hydroxymethylbilane synthase